LFTKNSSWQAKLLENVRRLRPKLRQLKNWLLHHTTHSHTLSFSPEHFWQKKTIWLLSATHSTFLCFPNWRWNWKAAILTQLRLSRQFRMRCWTHGRSTVNSKYAWIGSISRVMVPSRPKVSFWPDGATSPGNYGWSFEFAIRRSCMQTDNGCKKDRCTQWNRMLHFSMMNCCFLGC
jgi:hypothetical protein